MRSSNFGALVGILCGNLLIVAPVNAGDNPNIRPPLLERSAVMAIADMISLSFSKIPAEPPVFCVGAALDPNASNLEPSDISDKMLDEVRSLVGDRPTIIQLSKCHFDQVGQFVTSSGADARQITYSDIDVVLANGFRVTKKEMPALGPRPSLNANRDTPAVQWLWLQKYQLPSGKLSIDGIGVIQDRSVAELDYDFSERGDAVSIVSRKAVRTIQ